MQENDYFGILRLWYRKLRYLCLARLVFNVANSGRISHNNRRVATPHYLANKHLIASRRICKIKKRILPKFTFSETLLLPTKQTI